MGSAGRTSFEVGNNHFAPDAPLTLNLDYIRGTPNM